MRWLPLVSFFLCSCSGHDGTEAIRPPSHAPTSEIAPQAEDLLRAEPHLLRLTEHQFRLFRFLDERAPGGWMHDVDLERGTVAFVDAATMRPLLSVPVRLLGTYAEGDRTWMWGWGIDVAQQNPSLVTGFDALRTRARASGRDELTRTPVTLDGDGAEHRLVVTSAGALGLWGTYGFDSTQGPFGVYLGLVACPEVDREPFDRPARLAMLQDVLRRGAPAIDWERALEAYLGTPVRQDESSRLVVYPFGPGNTLEVRFDARGRVASVEATLTGEAP